MNLAPVLVALAGVLGYSAYYRFTGITERGMIHADVDAWKYLDVAKDWSDGNYTWMSGSYAQKNAFYRPMAHLLHMVAIRLWGYNDYSFKILNVVFDLAVVVLVFLISLLLTHSGWVGVFTALIYATIPKVLFYDWGEIPHAVAGFWVSASLLSYVAGVRLSPKRLPLLAVSGVLLGCAANIHPDLALLGPGFVAALCIEAWAAHERNWARPLAARAAALTAGFFLPYAGGMAFFGPRTVVEVFSREFSLSRDAYSNSAQRSSVATIPFRILYRGIDGIFEHHMAMMWFFAGALAIAAVCTLFRKTRRIEGLVAPILLIAYALGYAVGVGDFPVNMFRVLIPLLPVLLVATTFWYYEGFKQLAGRYAIWAFLPLACIMLWSHPLVSEWTRNSWRVPAARGIRATYDKLRTCVNEDNRLLILPLGAPHAQFARHWGLSHDIYFGSNALYLTKVDSFPLPYSVQALRQICTRYKVRYVIVFENGVSENAILARRPEFKTLARGTPYSRKAEMAMIGEFLKQVSARLIGSWEKGLYELPPGI